MLLCICNYSGGNGGGAIRLDALQNLYVNGTVSANGKNGQGDIGVR